ncbi:hypothetical protein [uncultured Tateyamaria sp.]|uniref:hypothetical protein n=1 Tax=uncultured Tateyamaria sp. TaxID=455651 RepID=UPI002639790D|nr:hypothetical protein [uncultured Tateyamaria sp.]
MSDWRTPLCLAFLLLSGPAAGQQQFGQALGQLEISFQQMMSGLRVKTAQTSASGNQVVTAALKTAEAHASAITQFDVRAGLNEAVSAYAVGRDQTNAACGPVEMRQMAHSAAQRNVSLRQMLGQADTAFMDDHGDAASVQATLNRRRSEYYCSEEEFAAGLCSPFAGVGYNTGPGAGDTNASVWMNGSAAGAEEIAVGIDYLDRVAPLPTVVPNTGAASAISRLIAHGQAAERSMARETISGSIFEGLE